MDQFKSLGLVFACATAAFLYSTKIRMTPQAERVVSSIAQTENNASTKTTPNIETPIIPQSRTSKIVSENDDYPYPVLKITVPSIQPGKPNAQFRFKVLEDEKPVLLSELLYFLDRSFVNDRAYVLDDYDCKHFAHQLYLDAVERKMAVRFVAMTIKDSPIGHAFNAFQTSDAGVVFVDFTSAIHPKDPNKTIAQKNIVYAAVSEDFKRIPLRHLPADFKNTKEDFLNFQGQFLQSKGRFFASVPISDWVAEKLQFFPTPFQHRQAEHHTELKLETPSAWNHKNSELQDRQK